MSDHDEQQRRIDELWTDPRYQRHRKALDRSDGSKASMTGRLKKLAAEAEEDQAGTESREAEYSARVRSNREAQEGMAGEPQRAQPPSSAPSDKDRDDGRQRTAVCPVFPPARRASLPRLIRLGKDEAALPGFPNAEAPEPDSQMLLPLPGIANVVHSSPSWLLWLFDRAGGDSWSGGRGAPWPLRLFVYALLHLDIAYRNGKWHALPFETETVIGWLHPGGWQNKRRDWDLLPKALDWMRRLAYVPVPGYGRVAMLFPSVIPSAPTDPLVEFTIRVPSVAAHGDRLEWTLLIRYGAESARLFRAYLAVAAWLGRSARRGHPITRMIAAPLYGPDGKVRRRKGGSIVRSKTRFIPNHADSYAKPELTERDLAYMFGFDGDDRRRRHEARHCCERMDSDGVIDLQRNGYRFVIFGPSRNQQLRRKSAASAAELLYTASKQADPLTRARLVDSATGEARRAVVHALRDVPRDESVSAATLKKAARRLEIIAI